ncbi:MAG: hypothetical protein IT439_02415 [Phycisphaerales bacterium]|nr:hypothetical protein [Phycisphaerales bacterium]
MRQIDLASPAAVERVLREATEANLGARCRRGSIDLIEAPGRLIATGDLHDNPLHFARLVALAGLGGDHPPGAHLTLHELIHSDRLVNGMDFSHRVLIKAAALKAEHPEHVHTLLANHELSQVIGAGIIKDGIRVVEAFNLGLEYVFGGETARVDAALREFIRSMPLALRAHTPRGDILCAHSLPGLGMMTRFDPRILERALVEDDYMPRQGSAHLMVWGRGYDAEQLEDLVERWGVNLFILGHEKAEFGAKLVPPNALILNSDHAMGVYLPVDLGDPPAPEEAMERVVPLTTAE